MTPRIEIQRHFFLSNVTIGKGEEPLPCYTTPLVVKVLQFLRWLGLVDMYEEFEYDDIDEPKILFINKSSLNKWSEKHSNRDLREFVQNCLKNATKHKTLGKEQIQAQFKQRQLKECHEILILALDDLESLIKLLNQREKKTDLIVLPRKSEYQKNYNSLMSPEKVTNELLIQFLFNLLQGYYCAKGKEGGWISLQEEESLGASHIDQENKENDLSKKIIDKKVSFATKILYLYDRKIQTPEYGFTEIEKLLK